MPFAARVPMCGTPRRPFSEAPLASVRGDSRQPETQRACHRPTSPADISLLTGAPPRPAGRGRTAGLSLLSAGALPSLATGRLSHLQVKSQGKPWPVCLVNHKPYYDHPVLRSRWVFSAADGVVVMP